MQRSRWLMLLCVLGACSTARDAPSMAALAPRDAGSGTAPASEGTAAGIPADPGAEAAGDGQAPGASVDGGVPDASTVSSPALALVYQGPGACDGCDTALAALLTRAGLVPRFVGPADLTRDATFEGATLYAQPGGDDTALVIAAVGAAAWPDATARMRRFVAGGGRFLGFCLGGFLAGRALDADGIPGFELLDQDVAYFEDTPQDSALDQVIRVTWLVPNVERSVYFQEGPSFEAEGVEYARYSDGSTAALLKDFGNGKVAVSGVHVEAPDDWYAAYDLSDPDGVDWDLGERLIEDLLR